MSNSTSKPIKNTDIIDENVFKKTIDDAKELRKVIYDLELGFSELLKETKVSVMSNPLKDSKDISELTKQLNQMREATSNLNDIKKEKIKIDEKLSHLSSEEIKRQEIARADSRERREYLKSITVLENQQAGTLEKLAAKNKQLSAEQKKLNLATLEGRTRLKEVNDELNKNNNFIKSTADSLKAQKINIGNYTGELRKLRQELTSLNPESDAFIVAAKKAGELKHKIDEAKGSIQELAGESKAEQLKNTFESLKEKILNLDFNDAAQRAKQFASIAKSITFKEMISGAKDLGTAIFQMGKVLLTNPIFIIGSVIVGAGLAIKDFTANIGDNTEALKINQEAIEESKKRTKEFGDETSEVNQNILVSEKKITEFQKQKADIIEEATQRIILARAAEREALDKEKKLIDDQVNSGSINILNRLGLASDLGILEKKELEFAKRKKDLNQQTEKEVGEILKNESAKLRKVRVDEIIKHEKELRDLSREIRSIQIEQIEDDRKRQEEKLRFEAKNRTEDTKKIIASASQKGKLIKEIESKLQQDLAGIRQKAIDEAVKTNLENENRQKEDAIKVMDEEKTAFEKNKTEADTRFQESNEAKILITKEGSKERLKAEIESIELERDFQLANDQLSADQRVIIEQTAQAKIDALRKKARDRAITTAQEIASITGKVQDLQNQKVEDSLNRDLHLRETNIEQQTRLAERGLKNQLAFEKEKLAQTQLAQAKQKEKEIRQAKVIAYFNAFMEFAKQDPNSAPFKALASIAIAEAISGAFKDGVEGFKGKGTDTSDSNLVLLSNNESVITADGTRKHSGLATAMNEDKVSEWFEMNGSRLGVGFGEIAKHGIGSESYAHVSELRALGNNLGNKLDNLEQAIKNIPAPQTNWDEHGNMIVKTVENGIRSTVKYMKAKPRI
jgi:hypothetical protein